MLRVLLSASSASRGRISNLATMSRDFIFRQLFDRETCTYSYIVGCAKTRDAAIIDPVYELVDRDLQLIGELKLNLKYAINTHVHADHVTGSGQLKKRLGASVMSVIGSQSGANADKHMSHGDRLQVGSLELESRSTPGHTSGCTTLVMHNEGIAFTGDALLIRGCGRTDFQQGSSAALYDSVHSQIFSLPKHFLLYPGHDYTGQTVTTVDEELQFNKRLTRTKEEFVDIMNNLGLAYPKQIDRALPANLKCGIFED